MMNNNMIANDDPIFFIKLYPLFHTSCILILIVFLIVFMIIFPVAAVFDSHSHAFMINYTTDKVLRSNNNSKKRVPAMISHDTRSVFLSLPVLFLALHDLIQNAMRYFQF